MAKERFAPISYLIKEEIIKKKDWNAFADYVLDVFDTDLRYFNDDALFSITDMLEWADSFRGI